MKVGLEDIREAWRLKSYKLPSFIIQGNKSDYLIYSNMRLLLADVLLLVTTEILSDEEVFIIIDNCNIITNDILDHMEKTNDDRLLIISNYLINFNESLEEMLMESECYESMNNFKTFNKYYYTL